TKAAITARTPRSPSVNPTAAATSRTMRSWSANRPRDAGDLHAVDLELLADRLQHVLAADITVGEEVDVRECEFRPRVDAQMGLREHEHAGHAAVRKDAELLADDGRAAGDCAGVEDSLELLLVSQHRGVPHPRVQRVQAHPVGCL